MVGCEEDELEELELGEGEGEGLGVRGGREPLKGDSERGLAGGVIRGRRMREKPVCKDWSTARVVAAKASTAD